MHLNHLILEVPDSHFIGRDDFIFKVTNVLSVRSVVSHPHELNYDPLESNIRFCMIGSAPWQS